MMEASEPLILEPATAAPASFAATPAAAKADMASNGDGELMAAIAAGDRDAFGELIERFKDAVVSYLTRLTGDRDRADDLAQETFLRLYGAAPRYRERGQLAAFVYRIATNLVRSEERRRRRKQVLLATFGGAASGTEGASRTPLEPAASDPADGRLLAREAQQQLAAAVAELPLAYRVPLVLTEIEGWPQRDVARLLRCREGTVKSRLFRARQRLRRRLAPYWNGEHRR